MFSFTKYDRSIHFYNCVLFLFITENEMELDLLSSKWQKPSSFDSFTAKSYGGSIFPSSFSRYKSRVSLNVINQYMYSYQSSSIHVQISY